MCEMAHSDGMSKSLGIDQEVFVIFYNEYDIYLSRN